MTLPARTQIVCAVCFVGAVVVLSTAVAAENKDIVEVVTIPFFEGQPPELFHHLGWDNAAFFRCKTSGKNFQVVSAVEIWADGKSIVSGYTSKEVYSRPSDLRPHDLRASVSVSRSADDVLTVRTVMIALDDNAAVSLQPRHVKPPDGLEGFKSRTLHTFTLRPDEERVVWAYTGKRPGGSKWGFDVILDPERDEELIDVSRKEKAELLIFMKMKLTSWLDD